MLVAIYLENKWPEMLATSSSPFISAPFSLKTIFSTGFILLEERGLTVTLNFLLLHKKLFKLRL